ncbi:hypothetical protein [Herbiconiux liangxiaofengii]|uniref:hypothetical protein n=1 Tax=Herbiconiux liangxiaofengii TaxID=3342795 RepID=UPI0035BAB1C4
MRRRLAAVGVVAVLLLSGCTQRYDTPDDRSNVFGAEVDESIHDLEVQPSNVRVTGSFDGIRMEAYLDQMSFAETREFIEAALPVIQDSPLGAMPVRIVLGHKAARSDSGTLEWNGYDPERAERYFAAVQLWLDVLDDPGVEVDEKFEVRAAYVFATVVVFDDRDLDAYRAELVGALEQAGYVDPSITVKAATT